MSPLSKNAVRLDGKTVVLRHLGYLVSTSYTEVPWSMQG